MEKAKSMLKSKTFWFNVGSMIASVALPMFGIPIEPTVTGTLIGAGNILLRKITSTKIK